MITATTPRNRFPLLTIAAAALALLFATQGNAQRSDKPDKPRPSPTPTATATPTCPLPDNYGVDKTVTREKPLMAVCHNGKILCLPAPAAQAHIQHGDTPLGPCNKMGNLGPCP